MNKKFSTLLAVGLLTGGALLSNVDAKEVAPADFLKAIKSNVLDVKALELPVGDNTITLTGEVDLYTGDGASKYVVVKNSGIILESKAGTPVTFKGRLVIAAEDVAVKNLAITDNIGEAELGGFYNNTAITVFADKVTIQGNILTATVTEGNTTNTVNGITLYPQTSSVSYKISGNAFEGFAKTAFDTYGYWYSSAFQVYQGAVNASALNVKVEDKSVLEGLKGASAASAIISTGFDATAIASGNKFTGNDADIVIRKGMEVDADGNPTPGYQVLFAQITKTPNVETTSFKANSITLTAFQAALADILASGKADGTTALTVIGATPTEITEAINEIVEKSKEADALISTKALSEAAILVNTVDADNKSTGAVALGDVAAPAGSIKVSVSATGDVVVAPIANTAKAMTAGTYYVLMDATDPTKAYDNAGTATVYESVTDKTAYLWTIDETIKSSTTVAYATLKNKAGDFLMNSNEKVAVKLKKEGDKFVIDYTSGKISLCKVSSLGTALTTGWDNITVVNAPANTIVTSTDLKKYYGESFEAKILFNDEALESDQFVGQLTPVTGVIEGVTATTSAYALKNADGNYIVMDTQDKYAVGNSKTYGYKLKTITSKALRTALADEDTKNRYAFMFTVYAYDGFAAGDNKVARIEVATAEATPVTGHYTLGALEVEDVNYLTAEKNTNDPYLSSISVEIGHFNVVDVKALLGSTPGFFTVTNKAVNKKSSNYGKVLGLNTNGKVAYVNATEALVGYPETQFAITYDADSKQLTLKNREQPTATNTSDVNFTLNAGILYNIPGKTNVFAISGDTIEIAKVTDYKESDGYLRLNADELKDQRYYVGVYSPVWKGNAWMVENHGTSHQIGLDTEKANATEWTLAPAMCIERDIDGKIESQTPDTISIVSVLGYYDGNTYKTTPSDVKKSGVRILKFPAYSLKNSSNSEYMAYTDKHYATGEASDKTGYKKASEADYFALKMTGNDKYNLLTVTKNETKFESNPVEGLSLGKVYGGDSADKGLLNVEYMYSQTENDIFSVEPMSAPEYRKIAMGDTIKVFRNESTNEAQVLFEKGEFLSIANAVQFPEINPALYVDTAYVDRAHNNRWEYLLAVNAKHWDAKVDCDVPGHPKHESDTTTGRFLVNLMDSAYVYGETHLHNNKFINEEDGESYAKLGFIEGYHTHDTLYLKRPNGTYNALSMTREDASHSIAKYAFRIVDQESKAFVIETGAKNFYAEGINRGIVNTGYLKWLNGVVVVVNNLEQADIFNLNADENRTPTTNEGVSASEVSIIAGNGSVVVKGAAGKSVAISNILGQTIVNTVLTSDNATIAVPAGIVVVAVEGEEAVKTVVK